VETSPLYSLENPVLAVFLGIVFVCFPELMKNVKENLEYF